MPSIAETRRMIKRATKRIPEKFPEKGKVIFRDGNLADVRVDKSPTMLKNCKIIGDPEMIVVGQVVSLKWEDNPGGTKSPTVLASGAGEGASGAGVTIPVAIVDDITIENSIVGLRVKAGGLDLKHLSFTPSMSGHTHKDSLTGSGWKVTTDGIISSATDQTRIHPDGMIALGTQPDILKLSSGNATYRMWVGDNDPASAPFSVSKAGAIKASSGQIASWNISTDRLHTDSNLANIVAGANPWIGLGTMTSYNQISTTGFWVGKDTSYKMFIGQSTDQNDANYLYWNGSNLVISGAVKSGNYFSGSTGWSIENDGDAEFQNITARGEIRASVFTYGDIQATAGTLGIFKSASKLYSDWTSPAAGGSNTMDVDEDQNGVRLFATGDFIRIKILAATGLKDVWLEVTGYTDHTDYTTYNVTHKSGSASTDFKKGTAIADYGPSGSGFITLSADGTVGAKPNMTMAKHSGTPWTSTSNLVRVGNLNGVLSISSDEFGIAFGKDLSDTAQPYGVFTNAQASLVGIAQTWKNAAGTTVAQVDPSAVGSEPLFWLGPGVANRKLEFSADGLLTLRNGVQIASGMYDSVVLSNAIMWCPFDGGPLTNNYYVDIANLATLAAPATYSASTMGFIAKYNKGAVVAAASTNYIENPTFWGNITDGFAAAVGGGSASWDAVEYYLNQGSLKIVAGATATYLQSDYPASAGTGLAVPNGTTVFAQCRVKRSVSTGEVGIQIRDITTPSTRATAYATTAADSGYELLVTSWTNGTGSTKYVQVRLVNNATDSTTTANFDCVQLELNLATPYFHGGMNSDYTWTGTSNNSTSTRGTAGYIKSACAWDITGWTISFWYTPTMLPSETAEYTRMFDWSYDSNNRVSCNYDPVNNDIRGVWRGNSTTTYLTMGSSITRGVPTHFCFTWDGTTFKGYENGTLMDSDTGVTAMAISPDYIHIGADYADISPANGIIDDFIVLGGTAITQETVTELYNASTPTICIKGTEIFMHDSGYGTLRMSASGIWAQNSAGDAAFGLALDDASVAWGGVTMAQSDILIGRNKTGSGAMWWDNDAGQLKFVGNGSGTVQAYIDTDGSIKAGGGNVTIDSNGITMATLPSPVTTNKLKWMTGTTSYFELVGQFNTGLNYARMGGLSQASSATTLDIYSLSPATYTAKVMLSAQSGASYGAQLDIVHDSDAANPSYFHFWNRNVYVDTGLAVGYMPSEQSPASGVIQVETDIYTDGWTDYSGSSTKVGWSGTPTTIIYYKKVGKLVFVHFNIYGTSNSTSTSFTLPYTCNAQAGAWFPLMGMDNGTWGFRGGRLSASTSTVNLYSDAGTTGWANTGTKHVIGEFFYQTA